MSSRQAKTHQRTSEFKGYSTYIYTICGDKALFKHTTRNKEKTTCKECLEGVKK